MLKEPGDLFSDKQRMPIKSIFDYLYTFTECLNCYDDVGFRALYPVVYLSPK